MFKGTNIRVATIASALSMALAAPVAANSEIAPQGYDAAITDAKKSMVANPAKALDLARNAKVMATNQTNLVTKDRLVADWLEGEALMRLNRGGEAASVIGFALYEASQAHKDDKIYADLLRSSASLKARGGDPREALAHFTMAQARYEQLGDKRSQAIVLQNIGSLYSRAHKFDEVLRHYEKAAETFTDDAILSLSNHNNIGFAQMKMGKYAKAEENFGKALAIAEKMNSPLLKARILTNLAAVQNLDGRTDLAEATAAEAMTLASEHATNWMPFVYGVQAQIELSKGNLQQADAMITQAFDGQVLNKTNPLFRDFHETATDIFAQRGKQDLAKQHGEATDRIDRQARAVRL